MMRWTNEIWQPIGNELLLLSPALRRIILFDFLLGSPSQHGETAPPTHGYWWDGKEYQLWTSEKHFQAAIEALDPTRSIGCIETVPRAEGTDVAAEVPGLPGIFTTPHARRAIQWEHVGVGAAMAGLGSIVFAPNPPLELEGMIA